MLIPRVPARVLVDLALRAPGRQHNASIAARMSSSSSDEVLFSEDRNAGVVTLNRPAALNSLTINMVRVMYTKLEEWKEKESVRLVVLEGVGGKAFCAGGDIRAITESKGRPDQGQFFHDEYILNNQIGTYPKPHVALVDGILMGGGVGVSVHGTFRVATEKTMFAMPETAIGLIPDVGGSYFLPRLRPSGLGAYLALTGERLRGEDCLHAGVATHMCKREQLQGLKQELAGAANLQGCRDVLDRYDTAFGKSGSFSLSDRLEDIERCFTAPTVEEVLERLQGHGQWGIKLREKLSTMSPTSLKVTLRMLQEGERRETLAECLAMEYRLVRRCCEDNDFYEGVRAVIVDKDNAPKWNPSTLEGVSAEKVGHYFSRLQDGEELRLPQE